MVVVESCDIPAVGDVVIDDIGIAHHLVSVIGKTDCFRLSVPAGGQLPINGIVCTENSQNAC
jgi:hypothetical protein